MPKKDPLQINLHSGNYLGMDFGDKKIGLAVGQLTIGTCSPLSTIRAVNQQPDWVKLGKLIAEWRPEGIVVGVSRQADGSDNPVTSKMLKFCRQLEGRFHLPVYQMDEALSTFEAKQMLYDDLKVGAGKLWDVQDQLAAQLILQSWMNSQKLSHHA